MIWLVRLAMILAAVGIMWWEGSQRPDPGVGFAVALALMLGTAFVGRKE